MSPCKDAQRATVRRRRHAARIFAVGLLCCLPASAAVCSAAFAATARISSVPVRGLAGSVIRSTQRATSENWAGYAVTAASPFRRVIGSWVEPAPHCVRGSAAFSAFWIGIGGFTQGARGLEQIGTDADCGAGGRPIYYAWYEMLPAPPVQLALSIHPGDRIAASVTLVGRGVAMHIRNLTTHKAYLTNVPDRQLDSSSAEWIAEAPSTCSPNNSCRTLPLANFGNVSFWGAQAATANGPSGSISDPEFATTELDLDGHEGGGGNDSGEEPGSAGSGRASTSSLLEEGSAFSVAWEAPESSRLRPSAPRRGG